MHDHATDGGREAFDAAATAYQLRLHLDNAHDVRTNGAGYDHLAALHRGSHGKDARLAEIEAAANLISDEVAAVDGMYLTDGIGAVYLAEQVDPRHTPAAGPLYRLTEQVPPADRVVDLLAATKASLAATRTYLDAHKASEAIPSEAPGEESGSAGRRPSPGAPQSSEVAEPRPAGRTASSGATSSGGAS